MEHIPDSAVGFLLNNLTDLLIYNYNLISGVKESVQRLSTELEEFKSFVKLTEKYEDNSYLEVLANQIRSLVHETEDVIESYVVEQMRQKLRRGASRVVRAIEHKLIRIRSIGKDIDDITKKVKDLRESRRMQLGAELMKVDNMAAAAAGGSRRLETFPVDSDDMVGFEKEVKELLELLTQGPKNLEVISVIGMLGLGKTTLARKVFDHSTVDYIFFVRAFVQVSQDCRPAEVFLKILRSYTMVSSDMYKMSAEELAERIRKDLENRQYLIVLDDVWDTIAWKHLKSAFPNNNKGSRILITSRHRPVALEANPKRLPFDLRFLYDNESQELLRKKVFGDNICRLELEEYEEKILKRCMGLPLAIVVVAGILLNNRDKASWWKTVAEGVADYDPKIKAKNDEVIKLSYNHLPYRLKQCFLYLGVFREDFEIHVRTLLQLWVSEGFILVNGDRPLEDAAADYLEELVGRSLVMVGKRRANGHIKTCRIHDTLRDFCKERAQKENLYREIKRYNQETNSFESISTDKDRRLCINSNVENYLKLKHSAKHVRSFLSFAKEEKTLDLDDIGSIPRAFNLLRIVDIRSLRFTRFPPELLLLVLLKYIAFTCNFQILPEKLSNLCNLQTLIVRTSSRYLDVKADIWNMPNLRHLDTDASTSLENGNQESSENANLQTLSTISPKSCRKEVFCRTPRLKKLGIRGDLAPFFEDDGKCSLFDCLTQLKLLENLKLLNDDSTAKLPALPNESLFPINLTKLTLYNTLLDWKHMSTLGKLEKLEALKLKDNAFLGESWETEDKGFRRLKVLHIGGTDLGDWNALARHFPSLTHLYLKHCTKLASLPKDFINIPNLQLIGLHCTNSLLASSAKDLHRAKLQEMAQEKNNRNVGFKVSVYPPDQ